MFRKVFAALALGLSCSSMTVATAAAGAWPERPVTLIVPWAAGGSTDTLARILSQDLGRRLHTTVVVENRPGAGGTIGSSYVARSAGDGYTFLLGVSGDQVNAEFLYPKLQYSPEKDLAPVSLIAGEALVFAARKDFPADGVQQFIDAAKKGTVSFGTSGVGSTGHLAGELLNRKIGGSLQAVPYKGGAPAVTDTMAGHLDVVIVSPIAVAQQIKTGQLKGIATTSSARLPVLSSVPTFKESGIDLEVHTWYMLMAPAKTPADVIAQMNAALNEALADKDVESKIAELGAAAKGSSPAELAELLAQERKRWGGLINEAGLKAQN